ELLATELLRSMVMTFSPSHGLRFDLCDGISWTAPCGGVARVELAKQAQSPEEAVHAGSAHTTGPSPGPRRPTLLMRNSKGVVVRFLGGVCGRVGDSCGRPELPRCDADQALEVMGELALVREARVCGDLRQGQVRSRLQQLLGPL